MFAIKVRWPVKIFVAQQANLTCGGLSNMQFISSYLPSTAVSKPPKGVLPLCRYVRAGRDSCMCSTLFKGVAG